MLSGFAALQLQSTISELFNLVTEQGWRLRIIAWNPNTGSEWEISPIGVRQTKKPNGQKIQLTVIEQPEEEGNVRSGN